MLPVIVAGVAALILLGGGGKKKALKPSGTDTEPPDNGGEPPDNGGEPPLSPPGPGPATIGGYKTISEKPPRGPGSEVEKGEPWARCNPPEGSPMGTFAAYGASGECMVFWKPETWGVINSVFEEKFNNMSKKDRNKVCAPDECVPDPYSTDPELFCNWVTNPHRIAFVKSVTLELFPQIPSNKLPAPEVGGDYFVQMVWGLMYSSFSHNQCGFNPVT